MSENDTAEGSTSRRTVLKGVGGAIATAGVSQVAAARVPDGADMVEIPKVMLGDEVWKTKAVPKKWWSQVQRARRLSRKLPKQIDGAVTASRVRDKDEIAGKNQIGVEVKFDNEDAAASANLPDHVESVPISSGVELEGRQQSCINLVAEYNFLGGQYFGVNDEYIDEETGENVYEDCNDPGLLGHGTMGCYMETKGSNYRFMLSAWHIFGGQDCSRDITGYPAHCGYYDSIGDDHYPAGHVGIFQDMRLDYALVENYQRNCCNETYDVNHVDDQQLKLCSTCMET